MQHFYDGQIRRYLTQTIRVLSNFTVKYSDGSLVRIPVMYGDADRQVASIIRNNSENSVNSVPRISVYISGLDIDHSRLGDSTYTGKVHIRERDVVDGQYTQGQGRNYTVERLMPTPFKLTMKADIWAANTDQKLQILEQILVLFNPSLELQTNDNYLDWTSLSVLNLNNVNWSSRTVPVGADTPIDIGTLTLDTPIWISPPVKVKHLGVITNIITSIYQNASTDNGNYIDGLGMPLSTPDTTLSTILSKDSVTISDYNIQVYNGQAVLLGATENTLPRSPTLEFTIRQGSAIDWIELFNQYPGQYIPGSSTLFLIQPDGTEVVGTVAVNPLDSTILKVNWDHDTYPTDTLIDSSGLQYGDPGFDEASSRGTFDAIIDPTVVYPGNGMTNVDIGDRFLIVEDISTANRTYDTEQDNLPSTGTMSPGVLAWGNFNANANDIIECTSIVSGNPVWSVIFDSAQEADTLIWQTNIYKSSTDVRVQFMWNGIMWGKSFEGDYKKGQWRLEL